MNVERNLNVEIVRDVDVIVAGAGTAGCIAAIAAGRMGARTLLVERSAFLGGMMTFGNAGLTKFIPHCSGPEKNKEILSRLQNDSDSVRLVGGIGMEIIERLIEKNAAVASSGKASSYVFTDPCEFSLLLLDMLEEANVEIFLHSLCTDVIMESRAIKGIVIENKSGRQIAAGSVFIDATGDGDIAYRAGAGLIDDEKDVRTRHSMGAMFRAGNVDLDKTVEFLKQNPERLTLHPFSLMTLDEVVGQWQKGQMVCFFVKAGGHNMQIYNSPDPGVCTLCCSCYNGNGTNAEDLTAGQKAMMRTLAERIRIMREEVPGFENCFLIDMPSVGVRETRHILGDYVLTAEDILKNKAFDDVIGRGGHPVDIRPIPKEIEEFDYEKEWSYQIPYRCLLAKNIDNLLLAGRCISNTHEASGCTRVTAACFVTGHAAGAGAALSVKNEYLPSEIDVYTLQTELKKQKAVL